MQITELHRQIIAETMANHGCVRLDMSNPTHYQFYMESKGGETWLKNHAPDLYRQLQQQRSPSYAPPSPPKGESAELQLDSYHRIENPLISAPEQIPGQDRLRFTFSCTLRSCDTALSTAYSLADFAIIDCQRSEIVARRQYSLQRDKHNQFSLDIEMQLDIESGCRDHTYRFEALICSVVQSEAAAAIENHVAITPVTSSDLTKYIEYVELCHPKNIHSSSRAKRQDYICISYNREGIMASPDYTYNVKLFPIKTTLPIHLPIQLHVKLKEGATFSRTRYDSYFDSTCDPEFAVCNFESTTGEIISQGQAALIEEWGDFTHKYVQVNPDHPDELYIYFTGKRNSLQGDDDTTDRWNTDLKALTFELWLTYHKAAFYASVYFNILTPKTGGKNEESTQSLPIIIKYDPNQAFSYKSAAGKNTLNIHPLFYQWGCLAKDALLYTARRPVEAQNVQIGDTLLTREGTYQEVRDIITGTSETIHKLTLACGYTLRLTEDHTLCLADGQPICASNVKAGDLLQIFDKNTGKLNSSPVTRIEVLPYNDTIYNFEFDEPTFIVAQGIVAGDNEYQQMVRPHVPSDFKLPEPNACASLLYRQLLWPDSALPTPAFAASDNLTLPLTYYCALKAILYLINRIEGDLYSEEDAQEIASYCAFLESNATYGGVCVGDEAPEDLCRLQLAKFIGTDCYVKLIPTAMRHWYNAQELDAVYSWPESDSRFTFHTQADILVPFHYPVENKTEGDNDDPQLVSYKPDFLVRILEDIVEKSLHPEISTLPPAYLNMGLGSALHLLIDTMVHENYSGCHTWKNVRQTAAIYDLNGTHIENQFKPYKNFTADDFDKGDFPAGIEQMGFCADAPYVKFNYTYPAEKTEVDTPPYSKHKALVNSLQVCEALHDVTDILYRCKGRELTPVTWEDLYKPRLAEALGASFYKSKWPIESDSDWEKRKAEKCLENWQKTFSSTTFKYDPETVYNNLVSKNGTNDESFDDLFQYVRILYKIQKGEKLYD